MFHSKYEQTLALAGIYQAASLVKQIANKGSANSAQIESSLETLFRFDANNVEEVYGSVAGVGHGVKVLHDGLNDKSTRDIDITGYVISLIMLERKLSNNKEMLDEISKRLNKIESQFEFFTLNHENTIAKLGQLYKDTISTLGPKIIVSGEQPYLSSETNANKVRALLLAGIRSAVLWNQCGGSRWQFLFGRKAYLNECEKILGQL
ncbi:MAG: high frequency lysogenization protein HflD [Gammaproteobacteria bacterium]|nr:high frequency lysogenization protein HflD [Gammaproteobacteria bacterium]